MSAGRWSAQCSNSAVVRLSMWHLWWASAGMQAKSTTPPLKRDHRAHKSLAKEVASRNILVNAVAPGYIDTDMTRALTAEQRQLMLQHSLAAHGKPEDVAKLVGFLVSEDNQYITGQVIRCDGGLMI